MKQKKYLLLASFLIIFLFVAINSALALEVQLPGLGTNPTLPQYVSFFFSWLIGIAGVLSLISFTIGAVGLINPNVEAHGEAKSRMISAVLGLVLTMASFIIINTINSNIINIQLTPLESVPGVFLTDGTEKKPCPSEVSDTLTLEGFTTIKYDCPTGSAGSPLLVWQFPQAGLEGENGDLSSVIVAEVPCGGTADVSGSFRIAFETPGIYYYLDPNCAGYVSTANVASGGIANPFYGKVLGVKIVNSPADNYGVILHKVIGLENGGDCSTPIIIGGNLLSTATCTSSGIPAYTADIFKINRIYSASGDGTTFYSEPYGWNTGANAGFYELTDKKIVNNTNNIVNNTWTPEDENSAMKFDYTNVDRPLEYQSSCEFFGYCPGSIRVKGSYLVGLYAGASYCQTFTKDVANLNTEQIIKSGGGGVGNVYVIPIK